MIVVSIVVGVALTILGVAMLGAGISHAVRPRRTTVRLHPNSPARIKIVNPKREVPVWFALAWATVGLGLISFASWLMW